MLIAIEGIDQAGKATQAERLCSRLTREGCNVLRRSFPEYNTPIGRVIASGLQGGEETSAEIIQLLCAANRFEFKVQMTRWIQERRIVVCDRYTASGIAYGTARGLPEDWVRRLQGSLPRPDLTIFLDISVPTSIARKRLKRDLYETDTGMLERVRVSYLEQSRAPGWAAISGEPDPDRTAENVWRNVSERLFGNDNGKENR